MKVFVAALALISAAPVAASQDAASAAPQAEPSPEAVAAARDMLRSMNFETQMEATARQSSDATFTTIIDQIEAQTQAEVPPDLEAQLREISRQHLESAMAEMRLTALEEVARIYARYFTAEEIRELQRLQGNPVLQKMQRLAPQFVTELSQIGVAAAARHLPEMMQRVSAAVAAWQENHQVAPPAPTT